LDNAPFGSIGISATGSDFFYGVSVSGGAAINTNLTANGSMTVCRNLTSARKFVSPAGKAVRRPALKVALRGMLREGFGSDQWHEEIVVIPPGSVFDSRTPLSGVLHLGATLSDDQGHH